MKAIEMHASWNCDLTLDDEPDLISYGVIKFTSDLDTLYRFKEKVDMGRIYRRGDGETLGKFYERVRRDAVQIARLYHVLDIMEPILIATDITALIEMKPLEVLPEYIDDMSYVVGMTLFLYGMPLGMVQSFDFDAHYKEGEVLATFITDAVSVSMPIALDKDWRERKKNEPRPRSRYQ